MHEFVGRFWTNVRLRTCEQCGARGRAPGRVDGLAQGRIDGLVDREAVLGPADRPGEDLVGVADAVEVVAVSAPRR